ncbi:hypothetical protein V5T82_04475 [Magnetovibrio sp. PR-2]|uniref:hypothetical protein n=1 Tax=Magnetovibrio sp. PR-2 TaxID=3120356 RepID=UPI002FCE49B8
MKKRTLNRRALISTAVFKSIAVAFVLLMSTHLSISYADEGVDKHPTLAAELLIVRSDLDRLSLHSQLPQRHAQGLRDRVKGGLGVLPWLLEQAGDFQGAKKLRAYKASSTHRSGAMIKLLDMLIESHPLNTQRYYPRHLTMRQYREARLIHDSYCAGCHDNAGQGDKSTLLPARDLKLMALEASPRIFLARLINGVKGDHTILFENPLTVDQVSSLWWLYSQENNEE